MFHGRAVVGLPIRRTQRLTDRYHNHGQQQYAEHQVMDLD